MRPYETSVVSSKVLWARIMDQFFVHDDEEIFNDAVAMALEWGENFGKPIQARLMQKHPQLTNEQADDYDRVAREVKSFAFNEFERLYLKQISAPQAFATIRQRYPLLNDENLSHLHSQGQYYAWHDHV